MDDEALAELREVMDDDFSILISTFIDDSAERVSTLKKRFDAADAEAFSKAAHSFKGSCINIGAPRLGDLCLEAEQMGRSGDLTGAEDLLASIEQEFETVKTLLQPYLASA
ncbi:Hpt domain-containing protein [Mangrovitalea sediminis]|uniref:Hpt domain-containing protein n=1 Tax=Mangrovitalea sediminis TaxID=1982043 RepID=UPI001D0D2FCC|nr:Hpt domain-containing protein [Mangrovitalea sediminis]